MSPQRTPIITPLAQRVEDFKQRTLPLVVWSAAALVVIGLLVGRVRQFEYVGIANSAQYEVSVQGTGTIDSVTVELYQDVDAGDVVATLQDERVKAAIATSEASIRKLRAEMDAARSQLISGQGKGQAQWTADLRRFQIDEESRRLEALSLRVVIEGDEVEQARLALELERSHPLLASGLISQMEFDGTQLQHDQVQRRLQENRVLLDETQREYEKARERRRAYESRLPRTPEESAVLRPLQEAIEVESRRLGEIEIQRASLVLRSPVVGQVTRILCRKGQSVVPGEPIVVIAERSVREIVAYLAERDGRRVHKDTPVRVASQAEPNRVVESVVVRVSPTIEALPARLWTHPNVPDYGRAVVIANSPAMHLMPGELVGVRFLPD